MISPKMIIMVHSRPSCLPAGRENADADLRARSPVSQLLPWYAGNSRSGKESSP
jgi:hypothetical protein